jgi:hypothetical protein
MDSLLVQILCIVLPFANEIAIILTRSGLPPFKNLYSSCFDETILGDLKVPWHIKKKYCTGRDYRNKIIIDLIAYLGIILFIGKNTLSHGLVAGVANGMVLIFCSIMLPSLFMGSAIHHIMSALHTRHAGTLLGVGLSLVVCLMVLTTVLETLTQNIVERLGFDGENPGLPIKSL